MESIKFKPPKFDGRRGQSFRQFRSRFEKFCAFYEIQEPNQTRVLSMCLLGNALVAFDAIANTNPHASLIDILACLCLRFDNENTPFLIRSKLSRRSLRRNETVGAYFSDSRIPEFPNSALPMD